MRALVVWRLGSQKENGAGIYMCLLREIHSKMSNFDVISVCFSFHFCCETSFFGKSPKGS